MGFLESRQFLISKKKSEVSEASLFFGCRDPEKDFIYKKQLAAFEQDKSLTNLHLAFSRFNSEQVYVQDKLNELGTRKHVWNMLKNDGLFIF